MRILRQIIDYIFEKAIWIFVVITSIFAIYAYLQIKNDNQLFYQTKERLSKQEKITDSLNQVYSLTKQELAQSLSHKTANDSIQQIIDYKILKLNNELLEIKDKVVKNGGELVRLEKENEETLKNLWTHQIEYFAMIIALLVGLIFFGNLEHLAKEKMEKEIAKITGNKIKEINENYSQFITHNRLKKDSKIFVLNKECTSFNTAFRDVMKLFDISLKKSSKYKKDIKGLNDAMSDDLLQELIKADMVIIENQNNGGDEKPWDLGQLPWNINTKDKLIKEISNLKKQLQAYQSLKAVLRNGQELEVHLPLINGIFKDYTCKTNPWELVLMIDQVDAPDRSLTAKIGCVSIKTDEVVCMKNKDNKRIIVTILNYLDIKIFKLDGNILQYENQLAMVELADKLCKHEVSLFYYGLGNFPVKLVNEKYQKWVSFANAPSQLYGNMLNMLKFKYEISEKFRNKLSKND